MRTKLYKLTPAQHVTLRGIRCAASGPDTATLAPDRVWAPGYWMRDTSYVFVKEKKAKKNKNDRDNDNDNDNKHGKRHGNGHKNDD